MLARTLGLVVCVLPLLAQGPIDPAGLPGTRILGGGGKLPDRVYAEFLQLAGGPERARIVLIPTASGTADDADGPAKALARWQGAHPGFQFTVLHTRDRATADLESFVAPLQQATGVWFGGGVQKRLAEAYLGTRVEQEVQAVLARGGVVGGTSAGTAIQTRTMIESGKEAPIVATGFDLVPHAISDQHFLQRQRLGRLQHVLAARPQHFGIGVDEGTAAIVGGRTLRVLGDSKVVLVLAGLPGDPGTVHELAEGQQVDLVAWQRAAATRGKVPAAGTPRGEPKLAAGALLLVGGGRIPPAAIDRFVELAGGAAAKVVLIPSAMPADQRREEPFARLLRQRGVTDLRTLDCAAPAEVTAERLAVLTDATAIWFGGGRQWRLCDAFDGTPAIAACHAVLARGGVIGGSSAGATIQGDFLVRGNPLGNETMWAIGYDRGFGFLPGVAIDQHFVARGREADLATLIARLPRLLGLGIDEGTAALVRGRELEVIGDSKLAVFDARQRDPAAGEGPPVQPVWLSAGARWDLVAGSRLER